MAHSSVRSYPRVMRVNFLQLAAVMLLLGLCRLFLNHDPWLGGAAIAMSVAMVVAHFVRVTRFKRFDQGRTFD
jgi:hypothetical protein